MKKKSHPQGEEKDLTAEAAEVDLKIEKGVEDHLPQVTAQALALVHPHQAKAHLDLL